MANKTYKVSIVCTDNDTGNEETVSDLTLNNVFLLGETVEKKGKFASIIMNTSIMDVAAMLASGNETKSIVRLASVMVELGKNRAESFEDELLNAIMKGAIKA